MTERKVQTKTNTGLSLISDSVGSDSGLTEEFKLSNIKETLLKQGFMILHEKVVLLIKWKQTEKQTQKQFKSK